MNLNATAKSASVMPLDLRHVRRVHFDFQNIVLRFNALDRKPGGREQMTRAELVEYDIFGGAIADIHAMLERAR
jgi:hypothetical protein